jgi:hypothetical protein
MSQIQWKQLDKCFEDGASYTGSLFINGNIFINGVQAGTVSSSGIFTTDGDEATTGFQTLFCDVSTFYCSLTAESNLTANSLLTANANTILGSDSSDTVTINADIASNLIPSTTTLDIGNGTDKWRNLYINNTASIASLSASSADIYGGNINNTVIGGTSCAAGTFTSVNVNNNLCVVQDSTLDGTLCVKGIVTLGDASGDSVTINGATISLPNVAAGTDDTVLIYNGSTVVTDEIDNRVWGSTLVGTTGTPTAGHIPYFTNANTVSMDDGQLYWDASNNRLGIRTCLPTEALTVNGRLLLTGSTPVLRFSHPETQIYGTTNAGAGVNMFYVAAGAHLFQGGANFNYDQADADFRVESQGNTAMLNVDASTDRVGIGTNSPTQTLDVRGSAVFNEGSADADFRVESNGNANMLFVDGGTDKVGIGTATPSLTLTVTGDVSASGDYYIHTGRCVRTPQFASGFAGNGLRIEYGDKTSAELDDLTVRGTMRVYELLINQIRATNGSLFVSSTGKVDSASYDAGNDRYHIFFDTGSSASEVGHGFAINDVIRAQRFDRSNNSLIQSNLVVTAVQDAKAISASLEAGSCPPLASYEYVRLGNTTDTDRQGTVYLTSDDSEAPFIDVLDEVTSHADWNTSGKIKVRMGKLDGLSGTGFGDLAGYGLWASGSAYLEGGINADFGNIGGFAITADAITGSGFFLSGSATGNDFFISASNFNIKANGDVTGSSVLFDGGLIGGITIVSNSLSASNGGFEIRSDGSATFASGLITFESDGDITSNDYLVERTRVFGDGSDGCYTVGSDFSNVAGIFYVSSGSGFRTACLLRDAYFCNLTISGSEGCSVFIKSNGYRMFVKDTLTICSLGFIEHNGADGCAGNSGDTDSAGGAGGSGAASGTLVGGASGGNGGVGGTN